MEERLVKKTVFPASKKFVSYADWQRHYLDATSRSLIPDTELWVGKRQALCINSLGCKGDELEPGIPVIGFFGDSATFGVSFSPDSWPRHAVVEGYQNLNCGVEGYDMRLCLERYRALSQKSGFDAVVVSTGWHNIIYNHTEEEYWEKTLSGFAGRHSLAFCSLATCIIPECAARGLGALLCSDVPRRDYANYFEYNAQSLDKDYFNFWANMEPSPENISAVLAGVDRYNRFLKGFCERNDFLFIDTHSFLLPRSYSGVPGDFFDVCHLRPRAYQRAGAFVAEALRGYLPAPVFPAPAADVSGGGEEDMRKNVYPLW